MASTWDRIPQTHRAILFEQFTDKLDTETSNLYDILTDEDYGSDEEMYRDISDKLEVRSFSEFLEKFRPRVYEYVTGTTDGRLTFNYTTNPIEAKRIEAREIAITSTYYEMLVNMYSQKGDSGVANMDFNDAKIREILTPKREFEAICETRKSIPRLLEKRDKAIKCNENTATYDKKIEQTQDKIVDQRKNPMIILTIGLEDAKNKITEIDKKILQLRAPTPDGGEAPKLLFGHFGFDDDGRVKFIPAKSTTPDTPENTDSPSDPDGDNMKKFALEIKDKLDATDETPFTKKLIVSTNTGIDLAHPLEDMDLAALTKYRDELVQNKQKYESIFKQAKEEFIRVLSKNVQKLLCVKIFFDHATVKGGDNARLPKAGLIVANCRADKLIDDKVKKEFESMMRHLGLTVSDENKLWFAILPHVLKDDDDFDYDYYDDDDEYYAQDDGTSFAAAKSVLKIMDECKIMTFFNFAPRLKTTFAALNVKTVDKLQDKLEPLNLEHAVYALPNFTIMRSGFVPLSDEVNAPKINVPAVYIDAAYVAAGMLIAAQQRDYWTSRGFKNNETFIADNACVRIDLESDRITPVFLTKFNRERSTPWNAELVNALSKKHFGFAFDGDKRYDERIGSDVKNTYILNARTLSRKNDEYKPIALVLMKDFVRAYLKSYSSRGFKLNASQLNDFLNKVVAEWKQQPKKYKRFVPINLLLREGEDITRDGSSVKVDLLGGDDFLDVEIVD